VTSLLAGTVSAGQTLVVTIGSNTTTITFGTGPFGTTGKVQTLADLNSALQAAAGAGSGTGVDANGDITIQANNSTSTISIAGGPASNPTDLSVFGITNTQAFPANGTVYGIDQTNFLDESIAGGSITAYDGTGTPVNMQFRWAKVDSSSLGSGHSDTWNLFYQTNTSATNSEAAWVNVGTNFTFNSTGNLTPAISTLSLPSVSVNGTSLGTLSLDFGSNGITQFSNASGTAQVNLINQNGSAAGQLQSIAVDNEGRIVGTYSNGLTEPLAEVTLANFNGPNNLQQLDGGAYEATADSGPPLQNATGTIVGSSLEASNVDIADQFSQLIVTQQAYAANTRVITTTNTMVQDLLDVIR
jgi:flagellar hook protein FlgE